MTRQLFSYRIVGLVAKWQKQNKWANNIVAKHRISPVPWLNHLSVHVKSFCCKVVIWAWVIDTSINDPIWGQVLFKMPYSGVDLRKQCSLGAWVRNCSLTCLPNCLKNDSSMFSSHVEAHVTEGMKLSHVGASVCPEGNKATKQPHSATKWV